MTLKYKQSVLIQNLVDGTSVPFGQPDQASMKIATQMHIPKQARLTLTNTVVTVPFDTGSTGLEAFVLPDRYTVLLGVSANLTIVKGNAANGIVAAVPISFGVGTTLTGDELVGSTQVTTEALTISWQGHTNDNSRSSIYPKQMDLEDQIYLYFSTDGTPTVNDTLTVTGTLDIYYFDLSKPGL